MTKSKEERQCKLYTTRKLKEEMRHKLDTTTKSKLKDEMRHKLDTTTKSKEERRRMPNATAKLGELHQLRTTERPGEQHALSTTETLERQRGVWRM